MEQKLSRLNLRRKSLLIFWGVFHSDRKIWYMLALKRPPLRGALTSIDERKQLQRRVRLLWIAAWERRAVSSGR